LSDPAFSAHEHAEHAEHAAHANDPFISRVSITIAALAVLAATIGSLETVEAGAAIVASSEAVLEQDKATDIWGEYQADSLKKHIYGIVADAGGANADRYKKTSDEQKATQVEVKRHAMEDEAARDGKLAEGRVHEHLHQELAIAATLAEIGIAICTVAIITRRRSFWHGSLALGLGAIVVLGYAYLF
jgi:hypothetical protein